MAERCTSSVCSGDFVCCLDQGHTGAHASHHFGNRNGRQWTYWDDYDADSEDYACSHTEIDLLEGKPPDDGTLWRCTVCGDVLKEVRCDPGDVGGTTWVSGPARQNERKVRYVNLTQMLEHIKPQSAVTDTVDYARISVARSRRLGALTGTTTARNQDTHTTHHDGEDG